VDELRKVFQQHVRDDKKELLPAILKALSEEEAEAVVERIEAEKADIEVAKRLEAEQLRVAARREREKAEAEQAKEREAAERVRQAANTVVNTAWAAPRAAQQAARTGQEVVRSTVSAASEVAQQTTDQVVTVLGATGERTQKLTESTTQNLQTMAHSATALARSMQEMTSEYLGMIQERVRTNLEGVNAVARCRSLPELLAAQGKLIRENLELTVANSRRVAELSAGLAANTAEASRGVVVHDDRTSSAPHKVA
jgi:hypothetical protein